MTTPSRTATWEIAHVGLCVHDVEAARTFYAEVVGLSEAPDTGPGGFSNGVQGLSLYRPDPAFAHANGLLHNPRMGKLVTLGVDDLDAIRDRLDAAGAPWSEIDGPAAGQGRQLVCLDPSMNLVGLVERGDSALPAGADDWILHHVNFQAHDVRQSVDFYVGIAGMVEGRWQAPPDMGDFSIDPRELAILTLGGENRGLHVIRPDAGFGKRNGFAHNPSIGGHPAFRVPDIHAVMARLDAAGVVYSDAGTYAMTGYHQVYVYDPSYNLIEINQRVG